MLLLAKVLALLAPAGAPPRPRSQESRAPASGGQGTGSGRPWPTPSSCTPHSSLPPHHLHTPHCLPTPSTTLRMCTCSKQKKTLLLSQYTPLFLSPLCSIYSAPPPPTIKNPLTKGKLLTNGKLFTKFQVFDPRVGGLGGRAPG